MNYYQVVFHLSPDARNFDADLLKNDLSNIGFDSFVDIDQRTFEAYCSEKNFNPSAIPPLLSASLVKSPQKIKYSVNFIQDQDWNAVWEATSENVLFGKFCNIRKENQKPEDVLYDIIINPKLSFGTANHPTTAMIINFLQTQNMHAKNVLDMGCGTAVLSILAKKMGAKYVEAVDIDDWAFRNAIENAQKNNVNIAVKLGSSEQISQNVRFDVIFANINLNILLENMAKLSGCLAENGLLVLSGFLENDAEILQEKAKSCGLKFFTCERKNEWLMMVFKNPPETF